MNGFSGVGTSGALVGVVVLLAIGLVVVVVRVPVLVRGSRSDAGARAALRGGLS